ncbi:hypothetical protein Syun_017094 [Stephania yunnanensis]|uniref:Uncharacterized protein n=1 Tax=Stephania yunnanensis TaxID=152371 RepID=A0AAP0J8M4_9MAGN
MSEKAAGSSKWIDPILHNRSWWETVAVVFKTSLEVTWSIIERTIAITLERWMEAMLISDHRAIVLSQDLKELEKLIREGKEWRTQLLRNIAK